MDLKSNKSTTGSISTTTVNGSEWNQLIAENNNALSAAGITASSSDLTQLKQSIQTIAKNKYKANKESEEWQKPSDWVDIRSGALDNSVYFLVGHSADYTTYPTFTIHTNLSNTSNTYDVFVDGIKVATSNHNTDTTLNWQTLALASGYDVTYPSLLRTHIVRVTPSVSTDKLYHIKTTANTGLLWAHFTIADKTGINLNSFVENAAHLEAITSSTNRLFPDYGNTNGAPFYLFNSFANGCVSLKTVPVIDFYVTNNANSIYGSFNGCSSLKTVSIANCKGMASGGAISSAFYNCASLTRIDAENCDFQTNNALYTFSKCTSLKSLPEGLNFTNTQELRDFLQEDASLQDTVLDCSLGKKINRLTLGATSTARIDGLKGITVSNEAPFSNGTSPQLDVSYTGLSRAALVNLFKSMPYNVGYSVVGNPTINNGVVSNFSSHNYLTLPTLFKVATNEDFTIMLKFTTPSTFADHHMFIFHQGDSDYGGGSGIYLNSSGELLYHLFQLLSQRFQALATNTTYWLETKRENNVLTAKLSTDGSTWSTLNTTTDSRGIESTTLPSIGTLRTVTEYFFTGSIDLNETYININGIPWFRGTAAVTKTCSVVGCAGTSSLTAEDKAICTNKGWNLTVS